MRRRRSALSHAKPRSTTHRCRPKCLRNSTPRRDPRHDSRARHAERHCLKSQPLSACIFSARRRDRPRPRIASSSCSNRSNRLRSPPRGGRRGECSFATTVERPRAARLPSDLADPAQLPPTAACAGASRRRVWSSHQSAAGRPSPTRSAFQAGASATPERCAAQTEPREGLPGSRLSLLRPPRLPCFGSGERRIATFFQGAPETRGSCLTGGSQTGCETLAKTQSLVATALQPGECRSILACMRLHRGNQEGWRTREGRMNVRQQEWAGGGGGHARLR